ncbi:MAG TPA: helicase-related protein [Ktedonobacteraceae bacterium]
MSWNPTNAQPSRLPDMPFADVMGRLFESGFNLGLLATIIQRTDLSSHFASLYEQELSQVYLPRLIEAAATQTRPGSELDRQILTQWVEFLLLKGYLAGSNFLAEFLQTIATDEHWQAEVIYVQCTFAGKNSLETLPDPGIAHTAQGWMRQFARACGTPLALSPQELLQYQSKGAFLNADTLLLIRDHRDVWRLLCVDLSVFALRTLQEASDLNRVQSLRTMLLSEIHYLRSRSVFTNLSIDADDKPMARDLLSDKLRRYFTAFKRKDKETAKFIQAASYACSFYQFLLQKHIVQESDRLVFHVVGYTDRAVNAMALKSEQLPLLQACQDIYRQDHSPGDIEKARQEVIGAIERTADRSFQGPRKFATDLFALATQGDQMQMIEYQETLQGFVNTVAPFDLDRLAPELRASLPPAPGPAPSLRDIHSTLVYRELASSDPYLFLTGHPGIGKTTAIVNFLKDCATRGEGFLFLYVSPRTQVNLDILRKFQQSPACVNFFGLTTNSLLLRNHHPQPTVHYFSELAHESFRSNHVAFRPAAQEDTARFQDSLRQLEEIQENLLIDKGEQVRGVLQSLCAGLAASLSETFPPACSTSGDALRPLSLVATVAIQSLRRTRGGSSTLKHLHTIFQAANAQGRVLPAKMRQIGQRIRYFFVMIDEVTGDEGGAEFLDGLHRFLHHYQLADHGIITKIIVADASLCDAAVIKSHLEQTGYEPHKIYVRRVDPQQPEAPLTYEQISFKRCNAVVINANAYPASALHLRYRVLTDVFRYEEDRLLEQNKVWREQQQSLLVDDILGSLQMYPEAQTLVYIQDKARLSDLIARLKALRKDQGGFERGTHYQEIHANLSEKHKQEIHETQDTVQVVFMTASASRGLSFKRARHIIVDIPRFAIEQNLMEILQVIYRGRGGVFDNKEKTLTFYLADHIIYTDQADRELAIKEDVLHLLNILLILKTAIMTRIEGSGPMGVAQRFRMIPIGGKSIYSAGETFSKRLSDLLKELQSAAHQTWSDRKMLLFIHDSLRAILSESHIRLVSNGQQQTRYRKPPRSYLEHLPTFALDFSLAAQQNLARVLQLPVPEPAYLEGGLLIVPIGNKSMRERYRTALADVLKRLHPGDLPDLLTCMKLIQQNTDYPESLRLALGDALLLLRELLKLAPTRSAAYEQESSHDDQHYVLPLFNFPACAALRTHFEEDGEDESQTSAPFRQLLALAIRTRYPADGLLPIGQGYKVFPFLIFRSFQLGETRRRIFTERYLFTSQEFNIINLILSNK